MQSPNLETDGLETVQGAANFLKVSRGYIYNLMDAGQLAYVKLGKCRRIPRQSLIDLAKRHTVGAGNAA